jgi:hypothetical protein
MDVGAPISYEVLERGVPVYARDGADVGKVEHVLAVDEKDIFDGIVIDASPGPGGWRFADADQVDSIHERGVVLALDAGEAAGLPEPSENPAAVRADPADAAKSQLEHKLKRAWDLISGNY